MKEIVDLKTKLIDHTVVYLAIGLHKLTHKSIIPLFAHHAWFREKLGNHNVQIS